ncbi:O-antigen ligase family protein [Hydrogenophaga sp.]|uniref:O-antigen ligase family protein n=1 Tax=Hydrogenophaga sp. TaxID=1904254 RepID=UPI0025BD3525|nr:O-antigen ligase family protein [Hydrogenophaga sp.]
MLSSASNPSAWPQWRNFTDQWCGWAVVAMVFAAPISRSLFIVTGLLFALGWMVQGQFQTKAALLAKQPVTAPLLLLAGIVVCWSVFSPAPWDAILTSLKVYSKLLLVLMILFTLTEERWRNRAWWAFGISMSIVVASTYANVLLDLPWSKTQNQGLGQDHSVFIEHVSQSVMTAVAVAWILQHATTCKTWAGRFAWGSAAVLAFCSVLFLLAGRSGLVAMALVTVVFIALATPKSKRLPVTLAAGLIGLAAMVSSPLIKDRILLGYHEVINYQPFELTSLGARIDMWRFALDRTLDQPLLGSGIGTYHQQAAKHFGHCTWVCDHPHNQYLFFGMELGLPGLLAFVWLLWRIGAVAHASPFPERATLFAFLLILVVDSLINVPFWWRGQSYFTYSMLGLLLASNSLEKSTDKGQRLKACEPPA